MHESRDRSSRGPSEHCTPFKRANGTPQFDVASWKSSTDFNLNFFSIQLVHTKHNTGVGSTTSAPRGGDIQDKEGVWAGRSQGSGPSGYGRTKEEAR